LAVEGDRGPALLQTQLEKLHDCLAVEVTPCP
jgi:acetolactate synthase regulatory subunit